ncbi:hypothetical protein SNEBB_001245 [Seison nebaliae]|nr:hypothetical protein SNEBB_001245 [Seison nebaliae]
MIQSGTTTPNEDVSTYDLSKWRHKVKLMSDLSKNFLSLEKEQLREQELNDAELARMMSIEENHQLVTNEMEVRDVERQTIRIIEAKLNKSYSFTRMDPFFELEYGGKTYRSPTAYNEDKSPKWDKYLILPSHVKEIVVTIFEERKLFEPKQIAFSIIPIPIDGNGASWYPLSGQMGTEKEGSIHIKFEKVSTPRTMDVPYDRYEETQSTNPPLNNFYSLSDNGMANLRLNDQDDPMEQIQITHAQNDNDGDDGLSGVLNTNYETEVKQLREMFDYLSEEESQSILSAHTGNVERAINYILTTKPAPPVPSAPVPPAAKSTNDK